MTVLASSALCIFEKAKRHVWLAMSNLDNMFASYVDPKLVSATCVGSKQVYLPE